MVVEWRTRAHDGRQALLDLNVERQARNAICSWRRAPLPVPLTLLPLLSLPPSTLTPLSVAVPASAMDPLLPHVSEVRVPVASDRVFKEECLFSFDSPVTASVPDDCC